MLLEKEANENHNDYYFYDELIRYATLLFPLCDIPFSLGCRRGVCLLLTTLENLRNLALVDSWE